MSVLNVCLSSQISIKDLDEASYILEIKLLQDHLNRMIGLSQFRYIDKILPKYHMVGSKSAVTPF